MDMQIPCGDPVLYEVQTEKKLDLNDDVIGVWACAVSAQPAMSLQSSCDISTDASRQNRDGERRRRRL